MPALDALAPTPEPPLVIQPATAAPKAAREILAPPSGQLILGTDKRNPVFTVYADEEDERLLVFYGFEIIEIVPHDREAPAFKLMLARLYNSGVKLSALCESFAVDPQTVRRWGQALLQGDPAELVRVLEGRSAGRKRTLAVENFARLRWPDLVAERSYGAVGRLLREIQSVFGVGLSGSSVSALIRELKAGRVPVDSSPTEENAPSAHPSPEPDEAMPAQELAEASPGAVMEKGETGVTCLGGSCAFPRPSASNSSGWPRTPD
jgi:hypothetical protein